MSQELRPLPYDEEDLEFDRLTAYLIAQSGAGTITQESLDNGEVREELRDAVQQGLADQQK